MTQNCCTPIVAKCLPCCEWSQPSTKTNVNELGESTPNTKTKKQQHEEQETKQQEIRTTRNKKNKTKKQRKNMIPSMELTYPTVGKGKSSSNMPYQGDMLVPCRVITHNSQPSCSEFGDLYQ